MSMQSMVVCHFCGSAKVTERDLCRGCGVYICEKCRLERHMPLVKHSPEEHVVVPDDLQDYEEPWDEEAEEEEDLDEDEGGFDEYGPEGEDA